MEDKYLGTSTAVPPRLSPIVLALTNEQQILAGINKLVDLGEQQLLLAQVAARAGAMQGVSQATKGKQR